MRDLTVSIVNALAGGNLPLLALVQLDFVSGTVRLCNAGYDFDWDGETWTGLGSLGKIGAIQESQELQMYGVTLELSGLPPEIVALAMGEEYQGRSAIIWLAPLDEGLQIIANPVIVFQGRMDTMQISMGQSSVIRLAVESRLVDWERPRIRRFNHEDQAAVYPDDKGFEYTAQMVEKELVWGR
jgi:hypothetical protein